MFFSRFGLMKTLDLFEVLDSPDTGFHEGHLEILVPVLAGFMLNRTIRVVCSWYETAV